MHDLRFGNNPSLAHLRAKSYADIIIFMVQENISVESTDLIKSFFSDKECRAGEYWHFTCVYRRAAGHDLIRFQQAAASFE